MSQLVQFRPRRTETGNGHVNSDQELRTEIQDVVYTYENSRPRTQQTRIGPSEIGEPCARKLAYKLSGLPAPEDGGSDPWYAIIGTAVHTWLSEALEHQNDLARERGEDPPWLIEQRVALRDDLDGTMDGFKIPAGLALDHKVVGKTTHTKVKRHGPPEVYRGQIHGYGLGAARAGLPVQRVAIAFYPRTTDLRDLYVWSEPFDPTVALRALERVDRIVAVVRLLNPLRDPLQFRRIPKTPSEDCRYCPWLEPGPDRGIRCPGNTETL